MTPPPEAVPILWAELVIWMLMGVICVLALIDCYRTDDNDDADLSQLLADSSRDRRMRPRPR